MKGMKMQLQLVQRLWQMFLYIFDGMIKVYCDLFKIGIKRKNTRQDKKIKVMIVKTGSIGDFVIWLGIAKQWCKAYPEDRYEITLVCNCPVICNIIQKNSGFSKIIAVDDKRCHTKLKYRFDLLTEVRKVYPDIVVNGDYESSYRNDVMFIKVLPSSVEKVGVTSEESNYLNQKKEKCFTKLIKTSFKDESELARYAKVLTAITGNQCEKKYSIIEEQTVKEKIKEEKRYFLVSPGARELIKCWNVEKYAELIVRIYNKTKLVPIILGASQTDNELAKQITSIAKKQNIAIKNLSGKTTLEESIELIRNAEFHIGNCSGNSHIANSVLTDNFVLVGGGHFNKYFPYKEDEKIGDTNQTCIFDYKDCFGCDWKCVTSERPNGKWKCVDDISVDLAWKIIENYLEKKY
ncbi:glycosyltransferase family 9 protein [Aminipila terrae]|uniref:Glycosyltransferase family 9 protein n=1 Tax=Aminipila terrae TaxID=2697030 RepID=A0A6P1ME29_9FIRM|nr:glycosyltransferase family 9 protein [Aminipila terrae]QHI72091.1 hypothetical protein Ami3637_06470 [Aminipila terrae]